MSDLWSELFKKYGLKSMLGFILAAFFIWSLAHWTAAAGTEVSILWGFVKYTKAPVILTENKIQNVLKNKIDSVPKPIKSKEKTIDSPEPIKSKEKTIDSLEPIELFIKYKLTDEILDSVINAIRKQFMFRELTFVESGKKIINMPGGTFFFLFASYVDNDYAYADDLITTVVKKQKADRYKRSKSYVEIHNHKLSGLHLICYIDEINASRISNLDGIVELEIMVSPTLTKQFDCLVSLPLSRIIKSDPREIQIDVDTDRWIFDLLVK